MPFMRQTVRLLFNLLICCVFVLHILSFSFILFQVGYSTSLPLFLFSGVEKPLFSSRSRPALWKFNSMWQAHLFLSQNHCSASVQITCYSPQVSRDLHKANSTKGIQLIIKCMPHILPVIESTEILRKDDWEIITQIKDFSPLDLISGGLCDITI